MRKILVFILVAVFSLSLFLPANAETNGKVEFVLFHSKTCPHCKEEIKFIDSELRPKYGEQVDFQLYEISEPQNQKLMAQYVYFYKAQSGSVPLTFVGDEWLVGYDKDKTTGKRLVELIEKKIGEKNPEKAASVADDTVSETIDVPVLGKIDPKAFSLPLLTVVIGLLDGFNPCAMWVLLFLISLLLGMENKKRMWLLGSIFIAASGAVYFLFMAAWLQFIMFVGMILLVRILIGVVAVGVGGKNLWDYWQNRKAEGVVCKVSKNDGAVKTFDKIKDIVYRKSLWWSILGIVILGFSVNLVELACSAGFPAIYTQVLALNGLPMWQKYLYMAGYIFFYMLDDLIVFLVAMLTLKSKVFGTKYAKYSNLIGGLLILILGLLLIFKPEWLMFS
ncbi:MAG: hypothetical protein A2921_00985 [Candidatus Magasanikbacteria bacterium RIFCSPLOWO2_01_FULL_43_20b]|uniref:Thioredoxin domain-containing protein n=1 Tax=Candidatus Magasanikbacteria bacterium RIFCSPLOWO2_12_FULL_43_12 TaxID=1798692 RepID=A0A1F6MQJ6_9BACT|nr:MAG: hypothetical protein A3C74_02340 [Candidatus Magasanikbacteria bacterium RIFCSPHIGHO2_02_FULL_44_13]OGH72182.1 MAG: hypothetical protein A3I93_02880 [Candidatus Magasanikbacteria bacterium RIFCSPLOWO2_02_FULL_43_22]OGH73118.1 MAG: hypothetical protein A2921_00985 [Candidatus Magasanikbacteria bacterium RIFCSPLOWO2_01_FULL_43_20b]OGH73939.1 MAG: hypothetical protein A3G00_03470 [Candidatus Magasanikbacteria bacterium RIFCSPLOWO2_12_FULL_43_12]